MKEIGIGLIGYKFMGKAHSNAWQTAPLAFELPAKPVMRAICGRDEEWVRQAAAQFGWASYETSWEALLARDDIDVVDITAPSNVHKEIAIAAARAGKHIFCEKPLALTLADAREMLAEVERAGVKHMIGFNYRRVPALCLARQLIEEGQIGRIFHVRATYLQDWIVDPEFPLVWRLDKSVAGSGSHGDLGAHLIDMARFLVGEFAEVVGMAETFIRERPVSTRMTGLTATAGEERAPVTVDDATLFLARFKQGALATFEATRFATGHKNTNTIEINGSEGSLRFSFERMNELEFYSRRDPATAQGFRTILVTEGDHPYMAGWWPPGHVIGYEHTFVHEAKDFVEAIVADEMPEPNFFDGVKCQEVLTAVEESVAKRGWVSLP